MQAPKSVSVHPIVLLSVVDHFNRVVKSNRNKRVVGTLVGTCNRKTGVVDVANSFAVPFEEDPREPHVWFLDHLYLEAMFGMVRRVNAKEKIVGWYTTGNRFKQHDIEIHEILRKYCNDPVFVIVDVEHKNPLAVPTEAYYSRDEVAQDGQIVKNFVNIASSVEACEPEEVGVEHLVREIKNINLNSMSQMTKINSLKGLIEKMEIIFKHLERVVNNEEKVNNQVIFNLQEIFNLLPNLNDDKIIKSFFIKNNDMMFVIYISSLIRSTIALHDLISNKLDLKEQEKVKEEKKKEEKRKAEEKEKEKKEEEKKKKDEEKKKEEEKQKEDETKMDVEKK